MQKKGKVSGSNYQRPVMHNFNVAFSNILEGLSMESPRLELKNELLPLIHFQRREFEEPNSSSPISNFNSLSPLGKFPKEQAKQKSNFSETSLTQSSSRNAETGPWRKFIGVRDGQTYNRSVDNQTSRTHKIKKGNNEASNPFLNLDSDSYPLGVKLLMERNTKLKPWFIRKDLLEIVKHLETQMESVLSCKRKIKSEEIIEDMHFIFDDAIENLCNKLGKECLEYKYVIDYIWSSYKNMRDASEVRVKKLMQMEILKLQDLLKDLRTSVTEMEGTSNKLVAKKVEQAQECLRKDNLKLIHEMQIQMKHHAETKNPRELHTLNSLHTEEHKPDIAVTLANHIGTEKNHNCHDLEKSAFLTCLIRDEEWEYSHSIQDKEKDLEMTSPEKIPRSPTQDKQFSKLPVDKNKSSKGTMNSGTDTSDLIRLATKSTLTDYKQFTFTKETQYDCNDILAIINMEEEGFLNIDNTELTKKQEEIANMEDVLKIYESHVQVSDEPFASTSAGFNGESTKESSISEDDPLNEEFSEHLSSICNKAVELSIGGICEAVENKPDFNLAKDYLDSQAKMIKRKFVRQEIALEEAKLDLNEKENRVKIWKGKFNKISKLCESLENLLLQKKIGKNLLSTPNLEDLAEKNEVNSASEANTQNVAIYKESPKEKIRRASVLLRTGSYQKRSSLIDLPKGGNTNSPPYDNKNENRNERNNENNGETQEEEGDFTKLAKPFINLNSVVDNSEDNRIKLFGANSPKKTFVRNNLQINSKRNSLIISTSSNSPKKSNFQMISIMSPAQTMVNNQKDKEDKVDSENPNDTSFGDLGKSLNTFTLTVLSNKTGVQSENYSDAVKLHSSIKKLQLQEKDETPLLSIFKIISNIYTDIVKKKDKSISFCFGKLYDFIFTRMGGNRSLTESKILQIVKTCLFYSNSPKIKIFLRLLNISGDQYLEEEPRIYFELMEFMDDANSSPFPGLGISINFQESCLVPLGRAIEYLNNFSQRKNESFAYLNKEALLNELKQAKTFDNIQIRKSVVDFDKLAEIVLNANSTVSQKKYQSMFTCLDIDKVDMLPSQLFKISVKYLDPSRLLEEIQSNFENFSDLYDENMGRKMISYSRFVYLMDKMGVPGLKPREAEDAYFYKDLNWSWEEKCDNLKIKLLKAKSYDIFNRRMIKSIEDHFKTKGSEGADVILMRYRLLGKSSD